MTAALGVDNQQEELPATWPAWSFAAIYANNGGDEMGTAHAFPVQAATATAS